MDEAQEQGRGLKTLRAVLHGTIVVYLRKMPEQGVARKRLRISEVENSLTSE